MSYAEELERAHKRWQAAVEMGCEVERERDKARGIALDYGGHLGWCVDKHADVERPDCQCGWNAARRLLAG